MAGNILNNLGSLPIVFASGKGSTLTDVDGKKYIDFVSGIGVNCLGHGHPALVKAIADQAAKQIHVSNYYNSDTGLAFSAKLLARTGMEKVFFCNSGAEANESAIKMARKYGAESDAASGKKAGTRHVIVTLLKSFHGRTVTTLSATGQEKFHPAHFAPYTPGFKYIPANDYEAIKMAFDQTTCALMIECVQGEGGVNLIDTEWAKAAAAAARAAGALVIADEVQTGVGRTGTYLASEALGFDPDIVTLAKGIAGGIPMGACLAKGKAAPVFKAGDHQSTFGGNPLACSGGLVVLEETGKPGFLARVSEKGDYIRSKIAAWKLPCVTEIRGKGLMIGIDVTGTCSKSATAGEIQLECLKDGLCISTAGPQTLRFLPPLVITMEEIDAGLEILKKILA
jgi:acetylornithine/N-succinyldiaminopimelate aminotransferase